MSEVNETDGGLFSRVRRCPLCRADGSSEENLPHGLQGGEAGRDPRGQRQDGGLGHTGPAEEAAREGGQMQTGRPEGEVVGGGEFFLFKHRSVCCDSFLYFYFLQ